MIMIYKRKKIEKEKKMKTLKFIGMAILLVVACGTFVACDGDDDEEENHEIMEMLQREWYASSLELSGTELSGTSNKYDAYGAVVFSRDRTYWFGDNYEHFSEEGRWSANDKHIKLFDRHRWDGSNLPNESRKYHLHLKTETGLNIDLLEFEDHKGDIHLYQN